MTYQRTKKEFVETVHVVLADALVETLQEMEELAAGSKVGERWSGDGSHWCSDVECRVFDRCVVPGVRVAG